MQNLHFPSNFPFILSKEKKKKKMQVAHLSNSTVRFRRKKKSKRNCRPSEQNQIYWINCSVSLENHRMTWVEKGYNDH